MIDPRRDPSDPPPSEEGPRIADALERIARVLEERLPEAGMRERFISQHDAQELVATATKSDRVREVVRRWSFEQMGRGLLWGLAIAGSLVIAAYVGFNLRACAVQGAPIVAPAH